MPPAVWVPAAAGLAGTLFQGHAQSQANRAQQQASNQAMALERERMAEEKRRYDQQYELAMGQRRLRDQMARQILAQHGINIPDPAAAPTGKTAGYKGTQPSLANLSPAMAAPGVTGQPAGGSLGVASSMYDSQGGGQPPAAPPLAPATQPLAPTPPASSMAGLTNWSDALWRRQ